MTPSVTNCDGGHRLKLAAFILAILGILLFPSYAVAEVLYGVTGHGGVEHYADTDDPSTLRSLAKASHSITAHGLTFNITYDDDGSGIGFDHPSQGAARKATFESALTYIASILNESGTLDVVANASQTDGNGFLASAGTFFSVSPGFGAGTAHYRVTNDVKPFAGVEEIFVTVDFGYNWNSTENAPGNNQFDLYTVLLHEITHGLGILTLCSSNGSSQIGSGVYSAWDEHLERSNGSDTLDWVGSQPAFVGVSSDLVSDDMVLNGGAAHAAHGSAPPVYAPHSFQPGSSLGHFDLGIGAVMQPSVAPGMMNRSYRNFEIGALQDIGWSNAGVVEGEAIVINFSDADYSVVEGDAGTTHVEIAVVLSAAPGAGSEVSVEFHVMAGTASAGADFTESSGTLLWTGSEMEQVFEVDVFGDLYFEDHETITLTLSNANGATIETDATFLAILDDDDDSDGDGLLDKQETAGTFGYVTNPNSADTDGDGLEDGAEISIYGTNPTVADTDGGSVSDGAEVLAGTDPTLASDDLPPVEEPPVEEPPVEEPPVEEPPVDEDPSLDPADVDGSGAVDLLDVQMVIGAVLDPTTTIQAADVNGDGEVNVLDVQAVVAAILSR